MRLRAHGPLKRVRRTQRDLVTAPRRRLLNAIPAGAQYDTERFTLLAA